MLRQIVIATDTWYPETNGVVRTLDTTSKVLTAWGHTVHFVHPAQFRHIACPLYPDFRLCWPGPRQIETLLEEMAPDAIHIATEGLVGLSVRNYCRARRLRFTTSYHTKTPEYLQRWIGLPSVLTYRYLKWFHRPAAATLVATPSVEKELRRRGFISPLVRWSRGVNLDLFHPRPRTFPAAHRPIQMYVGRVSTEKNLDAFLALKTPGKKYVVGDGPARESLERRYPEALFLGKLHGVHLAEAYANADVFVFPSKTDTFGLVILEALASGVPVAAYPAPGPLDILTNPKAGALDVDLGRAIVTALRESDAEACRALAREYTWEAASRQFLNHLVPCHPVTPIRSTIGLWPVPKPLVG